MQRMLDAITPDYSEKVLGRWVIDAVGDYMKAQIELVSTAPHAPPMPTYIGFLKAVALREIWKEYDEEIRNNGIATLSDSSTGLFRLLTVMETVFTTTQLTASAQYIASVIAGTPIVPFASAGMFLSPISAELKEIPPLRFSTTVDNFIQASYLALGKN